jgi:hypothetical protein
MSDKIRTKRIIQILSSHPMAHLSEMIEADVVIDNEGFILKEGGEFSRRRATEEELEVAEEVGSCESY